MEKVERKHLGYYSSSPSYIANSKDYKLIESDWSVWGNTWKTGTHGWRWKPFGVSIGEVNQLLLPLMIEIFGDKCAFCNNGPIYNHPSAKYYTLEHFKPKDRSLFPEYAYQWENLYPCCQMCNHERGNQVDALLLRPDDIAYDFDIHFEVKSTGELIHKTPNADVTIHFYQLNRPSLIKDRREKVEEVEMFFKATGDYPENLLHRKPYQFFLIRVLKDWKAKSSLPNLGDFISEFEEN
jgi:5-methylcytosine-specific restriction endonuclease McrA